MRLACRLVASILLGSALLADGGCTTATLTSPAKGCPTVALMTDFGESDFYVGAVKGVIRSIAPGVIIDDLAHQLEAYNVRSAAWNLYLAAREYPPGTVVVAVVDPGVGTERRPIALSTADGKLFVGPDNGLFTFVAERLGPVQVRHITDRKLFRPGTVSHSFHGRDIFGPTAAHLAAGVPFEAVGPLIEDYERLPIQPAQSDGHQVRGEVISADRYGNLHTNIPGDMLLGLGVKRRDLLEVTIGDVTQSARFVNTYGDVAEGEPLVLIASTDHLEIAVNMGQAKALFGATPGAPVTISRPERRATP